MARDVKKFEVGQVYNRRDNIHANFGGQAQGGISTPTGVPCIFLFTGESGEQYGYKDDWTEESVFLYTGEGQVGDMEFVRGNRAVRDHVSKGKGLLLFRLLGKGKGYRYLGEFQCASWEYRHGPDAKNKMRKVIVFHLVPLDEGNKPEVSNEGALSQLSLEQLRDRALRASRESPQGESKEARRLYYQRSAVVRTYVLSRANGHCESCKEAAPFLRQDGTPYLEPHHTRRLSDGGPDDPRWVAGICPTCHRRIHHGQDGQQINDALQKYLLQAEARSDT
jgi:5-methylcytosine-specific restriction protein A